MNRRTFLRGVGGVALGLPFLEYFGARNARAEGGATARAAGAPKRFILMGHHQGTLLHEWVIPQSPNGSDFLLGGIAQPLEPWREKILPVWGLHNYTSRLNKVQGGHTASNRTLFTANVFDQHVDENGNLKPYDQQNLIGEGALSHGASIDQVLAQRLQNGHPYDSVNLGVGGSPGQPSRRLFRGPSDPVTSVQDPREALTKFFAFDEDSTQEMLRIRAKRRSVLDAVNENFKRLERKVGAEDRQRLERHAEKIRTIERRLDQTVDCRAPDVEVGSDYDPRWSDWVTSPIHIDMLVLAMSCGLAPVGTLEFLNGERSFQVPFDWLTCTDFDGTERPVVPDGMGRWHDLVHFGERKKVPGVESPSGGSVFRSDPGLVRGFRWYTEQFVRLLEALDAVPEGEGTMLDNTCILWGSNFGYGHNAKALPVVLAGSLGDGVSMGRCVAQANWEEFSAEAVKSYPFNYRDALKKEKWTGGLNQLYTSLLHCFGFDDQSFGWARDDVPQGLLSGLA